MLIAKLQHRNLVKLFGCCIQGEEKMLIYKYMPNKSLDYFIFGTSSSINLLHWSVLFSFIIYVQRIYLDYIQPNIFTLFNHILSILELNFTVDHTRSSLLNWGKPGAELHVRVGGPWPPQNFWKFFLLYRNI